MQTQCTLKGFALEPHCSRRVEVTFDGGFVTSDAGALLLREVDHRTRLIERMAACFSDRRAGDRVEFSVAELLRQRLFGLVLGYEDIDDHDRLRHDPVLEHRQ